MRETRRALVRLAASWHADAVGGVIAVGWMLGYQQVNGLPWVQRAEATGFGVAFAVVLPLRRRHPVGTAAFFGVILLVLTAGLSRAANSSLEFFAWMPFLLAYSAGAAEGLIPGLAAVIWLSLALLVNNNGFNPFLIMITVGPWLAGRTVRSRRDVIQQLEARNNELEAERERFASESVRYERARIARELHDIVAHNLSVVVVQAAAGQRLCDADQGAAAEAVSAIAEAAGAAEAEIGRLVDLLDDQLPAGSEPGLRSVEDLVRRARAAGQNVAYSALAAGANLQPAASHAAYRAVQEALTNTLRHAPRAWVGISMTEADGCVAIDIENGPPSGGPLGLNLQGAGRGLAGLKDRVAACGGSVTAGPTSSGGWLVHAELPVAVP